MPGPEVKVSTSVQRLRRRVRNCCTKPSLLTTSRWLNLSTSWKSVEANYYYGCTNFYTCSVEPAKSIAADRAECSLLIILTAMWTNFISSIFLMMFDSALTKLTLSKKANLAVLRRFGSRMIILSRFFVADELWSSFACFYSSIYWVRSPLKYSSFSASRSRRTLSVVISWYLRIIYVYFAVVSGSLPSPLIQLIRTRYMWDISILHVRISTAASKNSEVKFWPRM